MPRRVLLLPAAKLSTFWNRKKYFNLCFIFTNNCCLSFKSVWNTKNINIKTVVSKVMTRLLADYEMYLKHRSQPSRRPVTDWISDRTRRAHSRSRQWNVWIESKFKCMRRSRASKLRHSWGKAAWNACLISRATLEPKPDQANHVGMGEADGYLKG